MGNSKNNKNGLLGLVDKEKVNAFFAMVFEKFKELKKIKVREFKILDDVNDLEFKPFRFFIEEFKIEYDYINSTLKNEKNWNVDLNNKNQNSIIRNLLMVNMDVENLWEKKDAQVNVIKKAILDVAFVKLIYKEEQITESGEWVEDKSKKEIDDVVQKTERLKNTFTLLKNEITKEIEICDKIVNEHEKCLKEFGLNGIKDFEQFVRDDFLMNVKEYREFMENFEERDRNWKELIKTNKNINVDGEIENVKNWEKMKS